LRENIFPPAVDTPVKREIKTPIKFCFGTGRTYPVKKAKTVEERSNITLLNEETSYDNLIEWRTRRTAFPEVIEQ
jgi:hypothetical protein